MGKKNFSTSRHPGGVGPPSVNLGPHNISESKTARKFKLKKQLDIVSISLGYKKFSPGAYRKHRAPNVNFGPP